MKTRSWVFVCALVALIALGWSLARVSTTVLAQEQQSQITKGKQPLPAPGQFEDKGNLVDRGNTATFAGPPAGTPALPIDLFTSRNFYKDQKYWLDARYFRCNTPRQLTDIWSGGPGNGVPSRMGHNPPTSAAWGDCSEDRPKDQIASPYPYKTAQEHYEALLAAAKAKGGPTVYTKATVPDWDGYYNRDMSVNHQAEWYWGAATQVPTVLSFLTPEYQKRFVQMNYHEAVDNSPQWPGQFCYPEGFMRSWSQTGGGNFQLIMNLHDVQQLISDDELRQIMVGQTEHVEEEPLFYGETIGFWDGDTLVAWTANVQAWWFHTMFEYSSKMEAVQTLRPAYDAGGKFVGLDEEVVFYDPVALVQPVHVTYRYKRGATLDSNRRYHLRGCLSNIRNVNGRPEHLTAADPEYIDYYNRPWAKNWEKYFEKGWEKPADNSALGDIVNSLK